MEEKTGQRGMSKLLISKEKETITGKGYFIRAK